MLSPSRMGSLGKRTVVGGELGRDIMFIFSEVKAAEDELDDIIDKVRVRSCRDRAPPCAPNREYAWDRTGDGAGRVATECREEIDVLRDG